MSLGRIIEEYFSLLDAGEAEKAAMFFEPEGRVSAPWETGLDPLTFIKEHLASAPFRSHKILDLLVSESGQSAAVHFEYSSKSGDDAENPTYVGCDHFKFSPSGKIETLTIYCHSKQPAS